MSLRLSKDLRRAHGVTDRTRESVDSTAVPSSALCRWNTSINPDLGDRHGADTETGLPAPAAAAEAPAGIERPDSALLRSLATRGSFTHAAERMFIAQPTLSQQIRRLEEIVGAPLLQRRREGLRLTTAGTVSLDASRSVLSLVDHAR